jgi:hypothetical protein
VDLPWLNIIIDPWPVDISNISNLYTKPHVMYTTSITKKLNEQIRVPGSTLDTLNLPWVTLNLPCTNTGSTLVNNS